MPTSLYLIAATRSSFARYHAIRTPMTSPVAGADEQRRSTSSACSETAPGRRKARPPPAYVAVALRHLGDKETFRSAEYPGHPQRTATRSLSRSGSTWL